MKISQEKLWAGTEESLHADLEMDALIASKMLAGIMPEQEDDVPYLYERQGSIGVVTIKGPLSNRTSWWDAELKRGTYPAIRDAMVHAANDAEAKAILLDIDSGGGAVAGVEDTGNLIRLINDKVKPVSAFTDGVMASAAYWLGSSAGEVFNTKSALVGSIGVITTHMEYSKALKEDGITATVMRAGKYKALANPYEPLSEEGKKQIQASLDSAYSMFLEHVAAMRGVTVQHADDTMAQGREFTGKDAVGADLTDGIMSYDALLTKLSTESIDTSKKLIDNGGKTYQGVPMKKALTEQQIAALAEGAAASVQEAASGQAEEQQQEVEAEVEGELAAEAEQAEVQSESAIVALLQSQLKDKDTTIIEANVKLSAMTAQISDMQAAFDGLREIAVKSVGNLQIALGGSAVDMSGFSAMQVLAEHKRLAEQFQSKFKAGGVAAVDAAQVKAPNDVKVDSVTKARIAAVRQSKK